CLNTQAVKRWRTVEHDRMLADDFFKNVPNDWFLAFDQFLGCLDRGSQTHYFETVEDERLEQFERHQLGQAALMQLKLGAHHNNRTARVIDPLAQQVLTE